VNLSRQSPKRFWKFLVQPMVALIWSFFAVFPIWFTGASVKRFLVYVVLFSLILLAPALSEKFRKIRYLGEVITILFCSGLLIFERSLFLSLAMPVVVVVVLLLAVVTYGRTSIRRIFAVNFAILVCLLVATEIGFRFATENYKGLSWEVLLARNSEPTYQYSSVETFRSLRSDGPGSWPYPLITNNASGLRTTTDQPASYSGRILIFGGSTTFCGEVPDNMTSSSILQRLLNDRGAKRRVENYGKNAATSADRVDVLKSVDNLSRNDIVIFYIGINEAGVGFTQKQQPIELIGNVPEIGTGIQRMGNYSRIANVLYRKLVFGSIVVSEQSKFDAVQQLRKSIDDAKVITDKVGASLVPVLQANLFTRNPSTSYDNDLGRLYGSELKVVMRDLYSRFKPVISTYKYHGDATSVMNNLEPSPYYDWMHVNAEGDKRIAAYFEKHLVDLQLID
jgi:lysophospholipase L1-like esterase